MKLKLTALYLALLVTLPGCKSYQQSAFETVACRTHTAVTPTQRDRHQQRFEQLNARVSQDKADIIFIGDSITQGWEQNGSEVWRKYYAHRNALNLGISGDRTQHVLWRLDNGNIDAIAPKVAVVMIGTNNLPDTRSTVEETADGVTAICKKLREALPHTKILLLGIFPREKEPSPLRARVIETNARISKLADGKMIHYLDIGKKFLEPDGSISRDVMYDYLHLTPKGYQIWADAIEPKLAKLLGEKK